MTTKERTVTVATSTLGGRLADVRLPEPVPGIDHLVVHQGCDSRAGMAARAAFDRVHGERLDVTVIELPGRGLSRSRNVALRAATGEWTHVCDDDVVVDLEVLRTVVQTASGLGWDVVTAAHRFAGEDVERPALRPGPHTRRTIGSVSSYDIVVRNDALRSAGVSFDESFGLGGPWPSGEEAIFLSDCLGAGLTVRRVPDVMTVHPAVHSGLDFFTTPAKVAAKREMIRRIFGRRSCVAAVVWWARKARIATAAGYGGRFARGMLLPRALLPASTSPHFWQGEERQLVLSGARSVSHLLYAASYVQHVVETGADVTVTLLDTGTFLGAPRVDAASVAHLLPAGPGVRVELPTSGFDVGCALARGATLVCVGAPSLRGVAAGLRAARRLPDVVVIDEGIGSYGTWRNMRQALIREGCGRVRGTVKAVARHAARRSLTTTRWSLYTQEAGGRWSTVDAVAAPFREHLDGPPAAPESAVILTQPWVELGLLAEAAYNEHLDAVEAACARVGLVLWVRPHPAERIERYAARRVVPGSDPAEIDRSVVGARVILGADSTALLNVVAVHERTALRVGMPELDHLLADLGPRQRSLLDAYLPRPVRPEVLADALAVALAGSGHCSW